VHRSASKHASQGDGVEDEGGERDREGSEVEVVEEAALVVLAWRTL